MQLCQGASPGDLFVRIGDTTLDSIYEAFSITVAVSQIKQHPGYDSWTLENDISVLVLAQSVSLTQYPNIKPACLPAQGAQFPGKIVKIEINIA